MISLYTIELREVLWTVAAVAGLYVWVINAIDSSRIYRMATKFGSDGVIIWAKFSNTLTRSFIALEVIFVLIGISAMSRPQAPSYPVVQSWIVGAILIGASVLISFIGFRWKEVNDKLTQGSKHGS